MLPSTSRSLGPATMGRMLWNPVMPFDANLPAFKPFEKLGAAAVDQHGDEDDGADDQRDRCLGLALITRPFSTVWISTAPNTVPTTPPRPPNRLVPPSTAAAMTGNSFWKPKVEDAAATWLAETRPPIAGADAADAVDREQDALDVDAGLGRGVGIGADGIDLPAEGGQPQHDQARRQHDREDPDRATGCRARLCGRSASTLLPNGIIFVAGQIERDAAADEQRGQGGDEGRRRAAA